MIYHMSGLALGERQRENLPGYDADFPYVAMDSEMDRYAGRCSPWHWHEPFEFVMVTGGAIEGYTQRAAYRLAPGEGLLFNSNALHMHRAAEGMRGASMHVQIFDRRLVAASGLALRRYVGPVAACASLDALKFSPQDEVDCEILQHMEAAFRAAAAEPSCFELTVSGLLSQAWRGIYARAREEIDKQAAAQPENLRVKAMLAYMQAHYGEELTPSMIAAAAGVCERECFRCFRRVLGTTPLAALTDFRVSMAAEMLSGTDLPVTEIALDCGFSTSGYFGKVFRRKMGLTPGEYRRRGR